MSLPAVSLKKNRTTSMDDLLKNYQEQGPPGQPDRHAPHHDDRHVAENFDREYNGGWRKTAGDFASRFVSHVLAILIITWALTDGHKPSPSPPPLPPIAAKVETI